MPEHFLPSVISKVSPTEENPIEIFIDFPERPIRGVPSYFIQFDHRYIASDFSVSFKTKKDSSDYPITIPVTENTNIVEWFDYPQVGGTYTFYGIKITITKALQMEDVPK
jgi:hypothetical protein